MTGILEGMDGKKTVLDPAGVCIYCGAVEELTSEHVIPFSLGGKVELPEASCKDCRDATSKIELSIARKSLHVPRAVAGYPSRRKKGYPQTSEVRFNLINGKSM